MGRVGWGVEGQERLGARHVLALFPQSPRAESREPQYSERREL